MNSDLFGHAEAHAFRCASTIADDSSRRCFALVSIKRVVYIGIFLNFTEIWVDVQGTGVLIFIEIDVYLGGFLGRRVLAKIVVLYSVFGTVCNWYSQPDIGG